MKSNSPSTHRACVSMILLREVENGETEVLIVHKPRKRDAWQIPQGGIEEGETVMEAAKRELQEETSITLHEDPLPSKEFYQYDYPAGFKKSQKPKYNGQHLTFVVAKVPRETAVIVDKRELDAFKWIHPRELPKYLRRENYRRVVEAAIAEHVQ